MATTETVIGQTEDGRTIVYFTQTGGSSYTQADNQSITITKLRSVEKVVNLDNDAGYRLSEGEASLSNNVITVPVKYYGYACPGAAGTEVCSVGFELVDGADISNVTISGICIGH